MDPADQQSLLKQGIQAVTANDRARARDCLLQVLEADDHNEPAWLWLSAVLDEPADQLMALEHVLAINPRHPQALAGASALRRRLGLAPAASEQEDVTEPASPQPEVVRPGPVRSAAAPLMAGPAPVGTESGITGNGASPSLAGSEVLATEGDPYQCAYCGRQTHPEDERCPFCRHSLLVPGPWRGGGYLYLALIVTGLQLQSALVQALVAYMLTNYPGATRILPLPWLWTSPQLIPALARAGAWALVVLVLLGDFEGGYGIAAIVAALDLGWAGMGYRLAYLAPLQAEANGGLSLVVFFIGLLAVISQAQSRLRLKVVPDRRLGGAVMFHRRAQTYARQGKWALAALHWRQAVSLAPDEPVYYKALGRANTRLGRYAEAVRAFTSGAAAAPNDPEFPQLIEKVRAHARSS